MAFRIGSHLDLIELMLGVPDRGEKSIGGGEFPSRLFGVAANNEDVAVIEGREDLSAPRFELRSHLKSVVS